LPESGKTRTSSPGGFESIPSAGRCGATLRSYWTSRGTEGRPLAAVALDGGEVELSGGYEIPAREGWRESQRRGKGMGASWEAPWRS